MVIALVTSHPNRDFSKARVPRRNQTIRSLVYREKLDIDRLHAMNGREFSRASPLQISGSPSFLKLTASHLLVWRGFFPQTFSPLQRTVLVYPTVPDKPENTGLSGTFCLAFFLYWLFPYRTLERSFSRCAYR
jgi:hypothetical protein